MAWRDAELLLAVDYLTNNTAYFLIKYPFYYPFYYSVICGSFKQNVLLWPIEPFWSNTYEITNPKQNQLVDYFWQFDGIKKKSKFATWHVSRAPLRLWHFFFLYVNMLD